MQIDYVISWVDGQDPQHKARRKFHLNRQRQNGSAENSDEAKFGFEKTTQIRFQDNGELYYNIASVLAYAPFIRRLYVVSDNQTPPFLDSFAAEGKCAADYIQLVSHDEIFAANADFPQLEAARPSFNSRAIEAALWRIPGLSEHFIYSNDDFFLNAQADSADFFTEKGAPILRGAWKNAAKLRLRARWQKLRALLFSRPPTPRHRLSIWLAAQMAEEGCGRYFSVPHCPHPLRQSVFAAFFRANPQALARQLSFRFRSAEQFNPVSLANHLELVRGAPAMPAPEIAYLDDIKSAASYAAFRRLLTSGGAPYGCIQDMGLYPPEIQRELHGILTKKFAAALPEVIKWRLTAAGSGAAENRSRA